MHSQYHRTGILCATEHTQPWCVQGPNAQCMDYHDFSTKLYSQELIVWRIGEPFAPSFLRSSANGKKKKEEHLSRFGLKIWTWVLQTPRVAAAKCANHKMFKPLAKKPFVLNFYQNNFFVSIFLFFSFQSFHCICLVSISWREYWQRTISWGSLQNLKKPSWIL